MTSITDVLLDRLNSLNKFNNWKIHSFLFSEPLNPIIPLRCGIKLHIP
jgi:hypothetical protein